MDRFEEFLFEELRKKDPMDIKIAKRVVSKVLLLNRLKKVLSIFGLIIIFYPFLYSLFFGIPVGFIDSLLNLITSVSIIITTGGLIYIFYISLLFTLLILSFLLLIKILKQIKLIPRINA